MVATAFGPQGPNYTITRPPTLNDVSNGADTWAQNCSAPGANDGTFLDQSFFNNIIGNMRFACRAAGVVLKTGDDTMLMAAIMQGMFVGNFATTDGNNLTCNLGGNQNMPLLVPGMRISGIIPQPCTGPMTLTVAGFATQPGTKPVYKSNKNATVAGDTVAGMFADFIYDGIGFQIRGLASAATIITANTTITVGPNGNYPSLLACINAISTWIIASNAVLTVSVAANYIETLNPTTGSILLSLKYGDRVRIVWAPFTNNAAFPSANTLDGQGATAVKALLQSTFSGYIQATGVDAFVQNAGYLGALVNCLVLGDGSSKRGYLAGNWSQQAGPGAVNLNNCGFFGFGLDGFKAEFGGIVQTSNVVFAGNGNNGCLVSHCSQLENYTGAFISVYNNNGVTCYNKGSINVDGGTFDLRRNTQYGGFCTGGGAISCAVTGRVSNNGGYGIYAFGAGSFSAWGAGSTFAGNGSGDAQAYGGGYNYLIGIPLTSASPAVNTAGNYGSYNLN